MASDIANTRRTAWDVTWNSIALGYTDSVSPELALVLADIKVGSLGDMVLGQRVIDLRGTIKIQLREVTRSILAQLTPWFTGTAATAEIPLAPAVNVDLYTYAQGLTLHPRDLAGATVVQDIELYKTVCITSPARLSRGGVSDDVWEIEMAVYPDRTKIGTVNNPWGRIKASA